MAQIIHSFRQDQIRFLIPEILEHVFSFLDLKSLLHVRLVCKRWTPIAFRFISISARVPHEYHECLPYPFISQLSSAANTLDIADKTDVLKKLSNKFTGIPNSSTLREYSAANTEDLVKDVKIEKILDILTNWRQQKPSLSSTNAADPIAITSTSISSELTSIQCPIDIELRIQKLILRAIMNYEGRLSRILAVLPMLTSIEIIDATLTKFDIFPILRDYPKLKNLTISFALTDEIFWDRTSTSTLTTSSQGQGQGQGQGHGITDDPTTRISIEDEILGQRNLKDNFTHGLEKLKLQFIIMDQLSLETLCSAIPFIRSFEVRFLRFRASPGFNDKTFKRKRFYYHLSKVCPNIESLHFTLYDSTMRLEEAVAIQDSFPKLKELSMAGKDTEDSAHGQKIQLMEHYVNNLTKLEVVCYSWSQGTAVMSRFHEFMCNARHLKHLIVPTLRYYIWCMDLEQVPPRDEDPNARYDLISSVHRAEYWARCAGTGDHAPRRYRFLSKEWGCQDLETLHIGLTDGGHQTMLEKIPNLVFGYITRFCPRLKDIWIVKESSIAKSMSNLCLIARLQDLEKIKIECRSFGRGLRPDNVNWIGCFRDAPNRILQVDPSTDAIESLETMGTPKLAKHLHENGVQNGNISGNEEEEEEGNRNGDGDGDGDETESETESENEEDFLIKLEHMFTETTIPSQKYVLYGVARKFLADEKWFSSSTSVSKPKADRELPEDYAFSEDEIMKAIERLPFSLSTESAYPCLPSLRSIEFSVEWGKQIYKDPNDIDLISSLRPDIKYIHSNKFVSTY